MARRRGVCGEAVWLCGSTVSTAWRRLRAAPHSWSNCCCVLCINRSHFQSENNLVVVANCACPLLSIHSNLRINWWSTDQNYDLLRYVGKRFWELYFLVSVTMGCLNQVDIKRRSLIHDIQRVLLPPFREGGAVFDWPHDCCFPSVKFGIMITWLSYFSFSKAFWKAWLM